MAASADTRELARTGKDREGYAICWAWANHERLGVRRTMRIMTGNKTTLTPWASLLAKPEARTALGRSLAPLLRAEVTRRLPANLAFDPQRDEIDCWIAKADALAEIHSITRNDTGALAGLLLLFSDGPTDEGETDGGATDGGDTHRGDLMIGYFLGLEHWGQGLASDMLKRLVARLDRGTPRHLFAGTDADNIASQRVLEKAGFTRVSTEATATGVMFSRLCGG